MDQMIQCPGCELKLPEDDVAAQHAHMKKYHPEIIAKRLTEAGFRQVGGEWVDALSSNG